MKRFYCKRCQRIRRARFIPANVHTPQTEKPADRIGLCSAHIMGLSVAHNVRAERPEPKVRQFTKTVTPVAKKGRK